MIARKKKICKQCLKPKYIWANGQCQKCASTQPKTSKSTPRPPIAKLSDKRKAQQAEYLKLRLTFLNNHQLCQVKIPGLCKHFSTEVHHSMGRTGELLTDTSH